MQTINSSLDKCIIDPHSNFFKQLQNLLQEPESSSSPLPYHPLPELSFIPAVLDLQHVIDSSQSQATSPWDPERSPSPVLENSTYSTESSTLFRQLYTPSGKWKWVKGHDIVNESSTFLSAGAMCSTYYKKGKVASQDVKYICKSWDTSKDWNNAFYSELALYKKQLRLLQGKCVPHVIGVYTGPGALNVAMEPPHSSFWIEASKDMPLSLKQRCVDAFAEIHSYGVYHGDIELRHMLIGGDARVTIIDFQESAALEPNEKVFLSSATEADLRKELRKVKMKLDFPGARLYEKEKRERCLRRNKHNGDESRKTTLSPGYVPQLEEALEDDTLNPPILDMQEWQDWVAAPGLPRLFIVPGQSPDQRKGAYEAFLASLETLQTPTPSVPDSFDKKPNGGPSSPHVQAHTELRSTPFTAFECSFPRPPSVQSRPFEDSSLILDTERKHHMAHISHRELESPAYRPNHGPSPPPTSVFERLALLRILAGLPTQATDDPLPPLARQLLNTETARLHRWSTRKRTASSDSQNSERPIKRTRLNGESESGSSASFTVASTSSSSSSSVVSSPTDFDAANIGTPSLSSHHVPQSDTNPLGLGAYEWLPNLRYPSLPTAHNEEEKRTWARIAMESLGHCALQELPHPDLIKLYPHHPRWAEPDVQVFLGRLHTRERELAWAALQNPERRIAGPRHPRSLGNLKRTLSEIQRKLENSSTDTLIRKEPLRREFEADNALDASEFAVSGPSDNGMVSVKQQNSLSSPYDAPLGHDANDELPRKVHFAYDETIASSKPITSSETTKTSHATESGPHYSQPWYSLVSEIFQSAYASVRGL